MVFFLFIPFLVVHPTNEMWSLFDLGVAIVEPEIQLMFAEVEDGGTLLPSPQYLTNDLQYFPPGDEYKLGSEDESFGPCNDMNSN